jgi:folate-binding protein YgfZ
MINDFRFTRGQFTVTFFEYSLTGTDVYSFLDSQSTFNVKTLGDGSFHLTSFLDPQGKGETFGWLIHEKEKFTYLVPTALANQTTARLHKFLVSEDVDIEEKCLAQWTFVMGETAGYQGEILAEKAVIRREPFDNVPIIPDEDVELWRLLNGWPAFDGSDFSNELINNQRLFDLAVSMNKGCYPGQETVSKIATRRGAAYSPVLLESNTKLTSALKM